MFGSSDPQIWLFVFLLCIPLPALIAWISYVNDLRWKATATLVFNNTQPQESEILLRKLSRQNSTMIEPKVSASTANKNQKFRVAYTSQLAPDAVATSSEDTGTKANLYFDPTSNELIVAVLENGQRLWCKTQGQTGDGPWGRWRWVMLAMSGYLLFAAAVMWYSGYLWESQVKDSRKNWVSSQAKIIASTKAKRYGFGFTYEYKIGDAVYHSTRLGVTKPGSTILAKPGDTVEVLYDPKDPSKYVLAEEARETDPITNGQSLATSLIAFAAVPLMLWLMHQSKPKRTASAQ
jgi:hypothetical protein